MTVLTRELTPDEVATYHQNGVVLLRGVLDLQTVNLVRRCIDQAVVTLGKSPAGYDLSGLTAAYEKHNAQFLARESQGQHNVAAIAEYIRASGKPLLVEEEQTRRDGRFLLDTGVSSRLRDFKQFVLQGAGGTIAGALLGSESVRFFGDQMFVKEPGTRERTAFHQDATYFEIEGDQCCVLWIPVDPVTEENGAMAYVRRSHRNGKLYKPNVFVSQTPLPGAQGEDLPDIEGHPEEYDVVSFEVEPGDILVHHFKTLHGAGGNHSRYQPRRAVSVRYCGDDIRVSARPWVPVQLHHKFKLEDGEPLSGPDFPVVWSRACSTNAA